MLRRYSCQPLNEGLDDDRPFVRFMGGKQFAVGALVQQPRQNAGRPEVESKAAAHTPCMRVAEPVTGQRRKASS